MQFTHDWLPQRVRFAAGGAAEAVAEEVRRLEASRVMAIASDAGPGRAGAGRRTRRRAPHRRRRCTSRSRSPSGPAPSRAEHDVDAARLRRRRLDHRARQGRRAHHRAADRRRPHDVRRLRGHRRLGPDRGRPQDDRRRPAGAAARGRVRREPDARPARRRPASRPASTRWPTASTRCGRRAPTRSTRPSRWRASAPCAPACPRVVDGPDGARPAASRRCTAPTSPAVAFASAGSGLHHKICHVLGGMFDLPHAETHAVVLPYVLALNAPAVPDLDAPDGRGVRRRLGAGRAAAACATRSTRRARCATSA